MFNQRDHIQSAIDQLTDQERKKLRKLADELSHDYVYFDISVFNAGAVIRIRATNSFNEKNLENGYSFYLPVEEIEEFDLTTPTK